MDCVLRRSAFWLSSAKAWRDGSDDTLRIPNEAACNLPGMLASAIGLADPAPIMVDISFQGGAITSEGSYIQTDWKLTNYQEIEPNSRRVEHFLGRQVRTVAGAALFIDRRYRRLQPGVEVVAV